jgi:DnaK suppressor protein
MGAREATMTQEQLARFRHMLETRRAELNRGIDAAQRDALDAVEGIDEGGDPAVQGELADTALGVGTRRSQEWIEIDEALRRIERGEYGRCEVDGEEIDIGRLEVLPTARTCAAHARSAERSRPPTL